MVLIAASTCFARAEVKSGPPAGGAVPELKVFVASGEQSGNEVHYPNRRADKPTVYILVSAEHWDRPVARFIKSIDKGLPEASAQAAAVVVWLTDKPDEAKDYLPKVQQSLQLQTTSLTVFPGE
jgi:hypothetical protein